MQRETYKLEVTAQDKGYPPLSRSVEVRIEVVDRANNPPVWDHTLYGPIYVKENVAVGAKVVSVKARSVFYFLFSREQYCREFFHFARHCVRNFFFSFWFFNCCLQVIFFLHATDRTICTLSADFFGGGIVFCRFLQFFFFLVREAQSFLF